MRLYAAYCYIELLCVYIIYHTHAYCESGALYLRHKTLGISLVLVLLK